jgi:hypothetical protein
MDVNILHATDVIDAIDKYPAAQGGNVEVPQVVGGVVMGAAIERVIGVGHSDVDDAAPVAPY